MASKVTGEQITRAGALEAKGKTMGLLPRSRQGRTAFFGCLFVGLLGGFLVFLPLLLFLVFRSMFMVQVEDEYRVTLQEQPLEECSRFFDSDFAGWASLTPELSESPSKGVEYPELEAEKPLYGKLTLGEVATAPADGETIEKSYHFVLDRSEASSPETESPFDLIFIDTDADGDLAEETPIAARLKPPPRDDSLAAFALDVSDSRHPSNRNHFQLIVFDSVVLPFSGEQKPSESETTAALDSEQTTSPASTGREVIAWLRCFPPSSLNERERNEQETGQEDRSEGTSRYEIFFSEAKYREGIWEITSGNDPVKVMISLFASPATGTYDSPQALLLARGDRTAAVVKNSVSDRFVTSTKAMISGYFVQRDRLELLPKSDGFEMTIRRGYEGPVGELIAAKNPNNEKPVEFELEVGNPVRFEEVSLSSEKKEKVELPVGDYTPVGMEMECGNAHASAIMLDYRLPLRVREESSGVVELSDSPSVGFHRLPEEVPSKEILHFYGFVEDPKLNLQLRFIQVGGKAVAPRLQIARSDGIVVVNTSLEYG
jgi:hypothetical protein